jgi:hypothetical protein
MVDRNPGVSLLWYTRRHSLLTVHNRPPAADGVLFQLGRPFKLEWYCRGRAATRAEILESMESGLPILRETAEKMDGPLGIALLEKQITQAYRLIPPQDVFAWTENGPGPAIMRHKLTDAAPVKDAPQDEPETSG